MVSSATSTTSNTTQSSGSTAMEKAMDVQKKQITQILDSAQVQAQQINAQKTGIGSNLNITA